MLNTQHITNMLKELESDKWHVEIWKPFEDAKDQVFDEADDGTVRKPIQQQPRPRGTGLSGTGGRWRMTITDTALQNLQSHWALSAIPEADRIRAAEVVNERLARQAAGRQITFAFAEDEADDGMLDRVALAYEIAAIEGLDALGRPDGGDNGLRGQAVAASHHAFDIRRLAPIPENIEERIFHVLQLAAVAYCGDRWSDLRRWFMENRAATAVPSVADVPWDQRLLYSLFECWVRLFRKADLDDLHHIREIIAGLRKDQRTHEKARLSNGSAAENRVIALRLIGLYHWAKATEIIAEYMLQGQSCTVVGNLDKHFESGIKAAAASGDARHEVILRWLHAAGRIMVTNSLKERENAES